MIVGVNQKIIQGSHVNIIDLHNDVPSVQV